MICFQIQNATSENAQKDMTAISKGNSRKIRIDITMN